MSILGHFAFQAYWKMSVPMLSNGYECVWMLSVLKYTANEQSHWRITIIIATINITAMIIFIHIIFVTLTTFLPMYFSGHFFLASFPLVNNLNPDESLVNCFHFVVWFKCKHVCNLKSWNMFNLYHYSESICFFLILNAFHKTHEKWMYSRSSIFISSFHI